MFSIEEIELLMQGLDAIERNTSMNNSMSDILTHMLVRDEKQRRKIEEDFEQQRLKKASADRLQKMQINILKGKLAQIAIDAQSEAPFSRVSTT